MAVAAVLLILLVYLAIAVNEELVFRGYQLRNLAEGFCGCRFGPRGAVILAWLLTSAFFGLSHVFNPSASLPSTLNILLAGLLLSLPYLLTGELAVSIGLHMTWNLFQGSVYGYPVSGQLPTRRLLVPHENGPELWTGGSFGPEAGLLATLWFIPGCVLVVLWVWLRQRPVVLQDRLAQYETPIHKQSVEITADPFAVHKG
jgi:membrane protease YdiL (CAAX protease family)